MPLAVALSTYQSSTQQSLSSSLLSSGAGRYPSETATTDSRGHEAGAANVGRPSVVYHQSSVTRSETAVYARPVNHASEVQEVAPGAVKASGNILKFIEAQLIQDVADGATVEELASRIEAGLQGFEQGFSEASEILGGEEGMTDSIWGEIGQTRELVLAGIESLREKYTGEVSEKAPVDDAAADSSEVSREAPVTAIYRQEQASKNSFQFQLTTMDGDKVSIDISSVQASILESYLEANGDVRGQAAEYGSDRFQLTVRGELDEEELMAINDLLKQVGDLASEFFSGDVEQAFELATQLGYDSSEISQFALNLKHTSVQKVRQAYEGGVPTGGASLSQQLHPLAGYVEKLLEAYSTAERFQQPLELLQSIAGGLDVQQSGRFAESMKLVQS